MPLITTAIFDRHGTLIPWERGFGNFLYDSAMRDGDTGEQILLLGTPGRIVK